MSLFTAETYEKNAHGKAVTAIPERSLVNLGKVSFSHWIKTTPLPITTKRKQVRRFSMFI